MADPKLKGPGKVVVVARQAGSASSVASGFTVAYRNDLSFRQVKYRDVHEALCITPKGGNALMDGLHLTAAAAHALAHDLRGVAGYAKVVEIDNHAEEKLQPWHSFSPADAVALATSIESALERAGK